jgi:hypothetical protein
MPPLTMRGQGNGPSPVGQAFRCLTIEATGASGIRMPDLRGFTEILRRAPDDWVSRERAWAIGDAVNCPTTRLWLSWRATNDGRRRTASVARLQLSIPPAPFVAHDPQVHDNSTWQLPRGPMVMTMAYISFTSNPTYRIRVGTAVATRLSLRGVAWCVSP